MVLKKIKTMKIILKKKGGGANTNREQMPKKWDCHAYTAK